MAHSLEDLTRKIDVNTSNQGGQLGQKRGQLGSRQACFFFLSTPVRTYRV